MPTCINCHSDVIGKYCADCGQRVDQPRLNLKALIADAANRLYGLDSTLVVTITQLITKPGFVAKEYIRGIRRRYVGPVPYYFMMFTVFLLLFPILNIDVTEYYPKAGDFNQIIEGITGQKVGEAEVANQQRVLYF